MTAPIPALEPMRSETFPYPERFAASASPLGHVCYFDTGPPEAPSGLPPVLLIHALGLNMTQWEYVAPRLAAHTRVIGIDLPGCGHSAKPRQPYTLAQMSQAVIGLLEALDIRRAVIFGHSFGGMIAMDVALQRRDLIAGLILMNSAGLTGWPRIFKTLGPWVVRPNVVAPLLVAGLGSVFERIFATPSPRTRRFISQVVDRYDPRFAWEFAHYASPLVSDLIRDFGERAHELTLPVQVLWGESDKLMSLERVKARLARLPNARVHTMADCGHMPNLERPEEVAEVALSFLRTLQPRGGGGGSLERPDVRKLRRHDRFVFDPKRTRDMVRRIMPILRMYFRAEVRGTENFPTQQTLLVANHDGGMLPFDGLLIGGAWHERFGFQRPLGVLVHDMVLRFAPWLHRVGAVLADKPNLDAVLAHGHSLLVYPGGPRETFRPFWERKRITLGHRTGFIRHALRHRVPITPVVSVGAHETFLVLTSGGRLAELLRLRTWARADVFPIVAGLPFGVWLGATFPQLPLPAKMVVEVLPPIDIVAEVEARRGRALLPEDLEDDALIEACFQRVTAAMQAVADKLYAERRFPILG